MAKPDRASQKQSQSNYGYVAEARVDAALARLCEKGMVHFWFRANRIIDGEGGVDHIFGVMKPKFRVWVLQISCGKTKRRTYYRKVFCTDPALFKKRYYRRHYHRYIPLLAVTARLSDVKLQRKIMAISRMFSSIFENPHCPDYLKVLLKDFLAANGVMPPERI